jgi:hypothetical protein
VYNRFQTCRQGGGGKNTSANADGGAETGKIKTGSAAMFGWCVTGGAETSKIKISSAAMFGLVWSLVASE